MDPVMIGLSSCLSFFLVVVCIIVGYILYFYTSGKNDPLNAIFWETKKVKFYELCDYTGTLSELPVGIYDINAMGIRNDAISSVKVPSGLKVTLYENGGFSGRSIELTNDVSCLSTTLNFDNMISSIKITNI